MKEREYKQAQELRNTSDSLKGMAIFFLIIFLTPFLLVGGFCYLSATLNSQTILVVLASLPAIVLGILIYYYVSARAASYRVQADISNLLCEINEKLDKKEGQQKEENNNQNLQNLCK